METTFLSSDCRCPEGDLMDAVVDEHDRLRASLGVIGQLVKSKDSDEVVVEPLSFEGYSSDQVLSLYPEAFATPGLCAQQTGVVCRLYDYETEGRL